MPRTHLLCAALVAVLGLDGAAVAMIADSGERDLVHATDPVVAHLDELQFTLAEGPCLDAHAERSAVGVADLAGPDSRERWPVFARDAWAAGAAAVFAFPLVAGDVCFGVLELYRRTAGPLDDAALGEVGRVLDALSRVALDELFGAAPTPEQPHSWPGRLTVAHAEVHQAAGMVAVHLDTSVPDALARLRAAAYSERTSLTDLAHRVVLGRTRLDEDTP